MNTVIVEAPAVFYPAYSPGKNGESKINMVTWDLNFKKLELFVFPPYTALASAYGAVRRTTIKIVVQNMCWEEQGQFTGEISSLMFQKPGVDLVMIGHSERRHGASVCQRDAGAKRL